MAEFVHLRVHSDYSLSEGASKIEDLVAAAKGMGMPALALTDKNNLFGALDFSKQASSAGVQPIIGCQLYFQIDKGKHGSVLLLAQDETGYKNLCAILRAAYDPRPEADGRTKAPDFPVLDTDALAAHAAGVILLTGGGTDGLLPQLVARDKAMASEMFRWLLAVFGDRLYVEICRNADPAAEAAAVEDALIDLAYGGAGPVECLDGVTRGEAPLVATTDVWYATPDRHDAFLLLRAIESKSTVSMDGDALVDPHPVERHLRPAEAMAALFADLPEAVQNTEYIARRCAFMVKGRDPILPPFACEGGRTEDEELCHQAREGLEFRFQQMGIPDGERAKYHERLEFELAVIIKMKFPGYFLIVSDFIKWAKAQGIPVGPGRGSGAGSLVAWSLLITDLDPLEFGLLFERFLNPERVSMPDFDVDFCQDRRGEVIQYVQHKYGSDLVSMIVTYGVIKSKTALTDIQRVLIHEQHGTVGFGDIKDLTKLIPKKEGSGDPLELKDAYEQVAEFRERIDGSPKLRALFNQARRIEGLLRTSGAHAAGIIIGDRPLHELVPVVWDQANNMPVAQFNMKGSETVGLVKFDFLGLKTLTVLVLAVEYIKRFKGVTIDLATINRRDPSVYQLFAQGKTTGLFQFESEGMRKVLRDVKPVRLEDLIAVNALFRPGPMDYIPLYAQRKNGDDAGNEDSWYPSPLEKTKPFLEETYGIMVYQEQVMQVAQACAGYSLGGADLLRRAMGKKIPAEMEKQRKIFIHGDEKTNTPGAVALGMDAKEASKLYDDIAKFAGYGFNKSHAAAYAWIAYQTAWLKRHYPVEFFSALMTYETSDPERLALIKDDLDEMGIALLPPDVNASYARFQPEAVSTNGYDGHAVRFGLTAIKGISGDLAWLTSERDANGAFASLEDFSKRVGGHLNKAHMERLAEAGAFDRLAKSRRQAASVLGWLAEHREKKPTNQLDMFGGAAAITVPLKVSDVPEWGDIADREFKAVGFYFSRHPIDPYIDRLVAAGVRRRQSFYRYMTGANPEQERYANLEGRKLCAMIDDVRIRQSKRGTTYLEAWVSERNDNYRISIFESPFFGIEEFRRVLEGAKACRKPVVFVCSLALDSSGQGVWVNGREVWGVDEFLADLRGDIVIKMSGAHIHPNRDEANRLQAIDAALEAGQRSAAAAEAERQAVRAAVLDRKVAELAAFLERTARSEDEKAVGVRIATTSPDSTRTLTGRFLFSVTVENVLKTMDGIISITEVIDAAAVPSSGPAKPARGAVPPPRPAAQTTTVVLTEHVEDEVTARPQRGRGSMLRTA